MPAQLMCQARLKRHAPVAAGLLAQIAVAVAILTVAPIRLGNLASIRLGENLIKPGGPDTPYLLVFPDACLGGYIGDLRAPDPETREQSRRQFFDDLWIVSKKLRAMK